MEEMTSQRFGGAVVHQRVLLRQLHSTRTRRGRSTVAVLARAQEAVAQDGQQSQDGHRQEHGQSDGA